MPYDSRVHHRKSLRLKGYDYSSPGSYFLTVCTFRQRCIFGTVTNSEMVLSDVGQVVHDDWRALPDHYPNVTLGAFQIMPNHFHAIITIRDQSSSRKMYHKREFGKPLAGSLSTIVGAYKSGVTVKVRKAGLIKDSPLWQSQFYDHIIRSDADFFMVEQYIFLNPVMWQHDIRNPNSTCVSMRDLETNLSQKYGITGMALHMIENSKKMSRVSIL